MILASSHFIKLLDLHVGIIKIYYKVRNEVQKFVRSESAMQCAASDIRLCAVGWFCVQ